MKTKIELPAESHAGEWFEVGPLNIGFKGAWAQTKTDPDYYPLVIKACADWNLTGTDGQAIPKPAECKGVLPEMMPLETVGWIIKAIGEEIGARINLPLPKKSP